MHPILTNLYKYSMHPILINLYIFLMHPIKTKILQAHGCTNNLHNSNF